MKPVFLYPTDSNRCRVFAVWATYLHVLLKTSKSTRTKALIGACTTLVIGLWNLWRSRSTSAYIGHSLRAMFWIDTGPGSLPFGRCQWRPIRLVVVKLFEGGVRRVDFSIFTDHADRLNDCLFQLPHNDLLRSHVSYGKTRRGRSSTLGIFHVCPSIIIIFAWAHPLSNRHHRWAIGLFLYQSLDAIDGSVYII